ncbi:MAG: hypothetical protein QM796_11455 [Chthoniobacteraceae bacterium]
MAIHVPSSASVSDLLAELHQLSDSKIAAAIHAPRLLTGLNRWSLWLLIGFSRHVDRQKWIGYIIESRLQGDLSEIGRMGAFGHPEKIPQSGLVPDLPEWKYYFHGRGCCLTNEIEGMEIDVDFDEEGQSNRIDPYFYTNFLDALKKPEFPEWVLKKPEPLHDYWHQDLEDLGELGCWKDRRVTELGMEIGNALAPVVEHCCKLQNRLDRESVVQFVWLSLHLGDYIHAECLATEEFFPLNFVREIIGKARAAKIQRAAALGAMLSRKTGSRRIPLQALAELGPEFSKSQVVDCLFHTPVDGAANAALEILALWQQEDFHSILEKLVEFRGAETNRSFISRFFLKKSKPGHQNDAMIRNSQICRLAQLLVLRQGRSIKPKIRAALIKILRSENGQLGASRISHLFSQPAYGLGGTRRISFSAPSRWQIMKAQPPVF